jgi:hypothetical protein
MAKKNLGGHKPTPAKMNPKGYKGKSSGQTHVGKKGPSLVGGGSPGGMLKKTGSGGDARDGKPGPSVKKSPVNKPPKAK